MNILPSLLGLVGTLTLALPLTAQESAGEPMTRALISARGAAKNAYIVAANDRGMRIKSTVTEAGEGTTLPLTEVKYFIYEPAEFRDAYDALKNKNYNEAIKLFRALQEANKHLTGLPWNYGAYAQFYEMEAQRLLGNIPEMLKIDRASLKKTLPMESVRTQISINDIWDKYAKSDWTGLLSDSQKMIDSRKDKLSTSQLAQLYFLLASANEGLKKTAEALDLYSIAAIIDGYNSPEITEKALLQSLKILGQNPAVATYMAGSPDPAKVAPIPVQEMANIANLWKNTLTLNNPLPKQYEAFLPFYKAPQKPKEEPADKPAADAKPAEAKPSDAQPAAEAPKS